MAVTQDVAPPWLKGMSWGLAQFFMYIPIGCVAPSVAGMISDYLGGGGEGLRIALTLTSLIGILGALSFFIGSRTYASDMAKVKDHVLEAA